MQSRDVIEVRGDFAVLPINCELGGSKPRPSVTSVGGGGGGIGGDSVITYDPMKVTSKVLFLNLAEKHTRFKFFRVPINIIFVWI